MVVLDAGARAGKPFLVVRFGNVLGSRGSVVPIFNDKLPRRTVNHYPPGYGAVFYDHPEAVYLVLQAAGMSAGGETFV
jgi:FlaA1/EpsC-like NDP-sugar epimerase